MSDKKRNVIKGITPAVTLIWPNLAKADKFNKMGTKARFGAEEYAEFEAQFAEVHGAAIAKAEAAFAELKPAARKKLGEVQVNALGTEVFDDNEEETGEYDVNFTFTASGKDKNDKPWNARPIPVFGKGGVKLTPAQAEKVWSGSVAKIAFEVETDGYFVPGTGAAGIKFKPVAVMLIELASGGNRSASSYGFDVNEGADTSDIVGDTPTAANDNDADEEADAASDF